MTEHINIRNIGQIHHQLGLAQPAHPLVSVIPIDTRVMSFNYGSATYVFDFYQVSLKDGINGRVTYGRNDYDYQEGTIICSRPGQAMSFSTDESQPDYGGWILLFHPDLIRKSDLGRNMQRYSFFNYDNHEALHLSAQEKDSLTELVFKIDNECRQNVDRHTQKLVISTIELILDYCARFYDRQFYFRTNLNQDIVSQFENLLDDYFESDRVLESGLPSVKYCGQQLSLSSSYLSDLLKKETGRSAQQLIQEAIVERAKNRLLGSSDKVSQIAYQLGFAYPQHFSKLFKSNTGMSPAEYRRIH